ncbi:MAG: hypothetical protein N3D83_12670 [Pyrobaculum aerophilum]|nr:hypothetical protein [Pyrobaculum aerophilum]
MYIKVASVVYVAAETRKAHTAARIGAGTPALKGGEIFVGLAYA